VKLELNKPFKTDQPTIDIDAGLTIGTYTFQLIVVNERGQRSNPTEAVVNIVRDRFVSPVTPPIDLRPVIVTPVVPPIDVRPVVVTPVSPSGPIR
jgi:hypothetical protein